MFRRPKGDEMHARYKSGDPTPCSFFFVSSLVSRSNHEVMHSRLWTFVKMVKHLQSSQPDSTMKHAVLAHDVLPLARRQDEGAGTKAAKSSSHLALQCTILSFIHPPVFFFVFLGFVLYKHSSGH